MTRLRYLRRLAARAPSALAVSAELAHELAKGETMNESRIATLAESISRDAHDLTALVRAVAVEPPPRELAPLIVQLADVVTETAEHYAKYAGKPRTIKGVYSCEQEETEWRILHRRHGEIVEAIERYAVAACGTVPRTKAANETQSGWATATSARTP